MKTFLTSRRVRAVASRYLGATAVVSAQTRTRSPRDTLDRLERAAPRSDHNKPKIEGRLNFDVPTGTAGSTRTARRPSARRRAATAATARGPILVLVLPSGLAKIVEPRYVNKSARMGEDASRRTLVSARRSGTATTAGCPCAIRASSRLMEPPKPGRACPKVTPRSDLIRDQERGPCTGPASSRRGAMPQKVLIVRNRKGPIRSWRPRAVRTTCMLLGLETDQNGVIHLKCEKTPGRSSSTRRLPIRPQHL